LKGRHGGLVVEVVVVVVVLVVFKVEGVVTEFEFRVDVAEDANEAKEFDCLLALEDGEFLFEIVEPEFP
jgi:hypothetical protein